MSRTLQERQSTAADFAAHSAFGFMCTADPGTGTSIANEATGGAPAYARKPLVWSAPDATATATATATFDLPPGTYAYAGTATTATGATMWDNGQIATVTYSQQAQHTLVFSFQGK